MRIAFMMCLLGMLALASGCGSGGTSSTRGPLFAGTLEAGSFWKYPLTASSNEGGEFEKGSRVEVYDEFIVVTPKDGTSRIHPHDYYSGLRIKKD